MLRWVIITIVLALLSLWGWGQAYIGMNVREVKQDMQEAVLYAEYNIGQNSGDSDSTLIVETEYFKLFCRVNYYTGRITHYYMLATDRVFDANYRSLLDQKYTKPYANTWKTPNGVWVIYRYLEQLNKWGYDIYR